MIAPPKRPAPDELEALIKEARERQLRRRLLSAVAIAIAAAVGLGLYAFLTGGAVDRTTSRSPNTLVGAPLCRAAQVSATADGLNGGGFGTMDGPATLTNVSGGACSLPTGRPRVHIRWRGRILAVRETKESSEGPPLPVLAVHSRAEIFLSWSNWCGKPSEGERPVSQIRPTFVVLFSNGLRVDAPGWVARTPLCLSPDKASYLAVSRPVRLKF